MTEITGSPYSIEAIVPQEHRRFLKIRDEFMRITGRGVVDACVLEMVLFETSRLLRVMDVPTKTTQFNIFYKGTSPIADSSLWVPMPSKRVLERLCGFASSERTVERSFKRLEKSELVLVPAEQQKGGAYRKVLLNAPGVTAALAGAGFSEDEWNDGVEAIKGSTSILSLPAAKYHSLMPVLVEAIELATQESEEAPARMSLLLLQALWLSGESVAKGHGPALPYSRDSLGPQMRFGNKDNWWTHLKMLGSKNLLIRRKDLEKSRTRYYEPNLEIIRRYVDMAVLRRQGHVIENPTDWADVPDTLGGSTRHEGRPQPTRRAEDPDSLGSDGHIPELSPELQKELREREKTPATESPVPSVPLSSLPRISPEDSYFRPNTVRSLKVPESLWFLDLPALNLRPDVIEQCASIDGDPIVLAGGFGTGKTVLAAAIMWALMEKAQAYGTKIGLWVELEAIAPDIRRLPFGSDGYEAAVDKVMSASSTKGPVVLDGAEEADGKNLEGVMKDAVSKLLNSESQVIITTHLTADQLDLAFGPKIGARLRSEGTIIDCSSPVWTPSVPNLRVVAE